jgi:hypothetical protein
VDPPPDELLPDEQAAMITVTARAARPRTTGPTLGLPEVAFIIPVRSPQVFSTSMSFVVKAAPPRVIEVVSG